MCIRQDYIKVSYLSIILQCGLSLARTGKMVYHNGCIKFLQKEGILNMITADMTIASVMKLDPEVAPVFW